MIDVQERRFLGGYLFIAQDKDGCLGAVVICDCEQCIVPLRLGSLIMKLSAMVSNGIAASFGGIGTRGALVGRVFTLFCWQSAHPLT